MVAVGSTPKQPANKLATAPKPANSPAGAQNKPKSTTAAQNKPAAPSANAGTATQNKPAAATQNTGAAAQSKPVVSAPNADTSTQSKPANGASTGANPSQSSLSSISPLGTGQGATSPTATPGSAADFNQNFNQTLDSLADYNKSLLDSIGQNFSPKTAPGNTPADATVNKPFNPTTAEQAEFKAHPEYYKTLSDSINKAKTNPEQGMKELEFLAGGKEQAQKIAQAHGIGNTTPTGNTTAPADASSSNTPAGAGDSGTPANSGNTTAPAGAGDGSAPANSGDTTTPAGAGDSGTPASSGNTTAPAGSEDSSATNSGDTTTPTSADDSSSTGSSDTATPAGAGDGSTAEPGSASKFIQNFDQTLDAMADYNKSLLDSIGQNFSKFSPDNTSATNTPTGADGDPTDTTANKPFNPTAAEQAQLKAHPDYYKALSDSINKAKTDPKQGMKELEFLAGGKEQATKIMEAQNKPAASAGAGEGSPKPGSYNRLTSLG